MARPRTQSSQPATEQQVAAGWRPDSRVEAEPDWARRPGRRRWRPGVEQPARAAGLGSWRNGGHGVLLRRSGPRTRRTRRSQPEEDGSCGQGGLAEPRGREPGEAAAGRGAAAAAGSDGVAGGRRSRRAEPRRGPGAQTAREAGATVAAGLDGAAGGGRSRRAELRPGPGAQTALEAGAGGRGTGGQETDLPEATRGGGARERCGAGRWGGVAWGALLLLAAKDVRETGPIARWREPEGRRARGRDAGSPWRRWHAAGWRANWQAAGTRGPGGQRSSGGVAGAGAGQRVRRQVAAGASVEEPTEQRFLRRARQSKTQRRRPAGQRLRPRTRARAEKSEVGRSSSRPAG